MDALLLVASIAAILIVGGMSIFNMHDQYDSHAEKRRLMQWRLVSVAVATLVAVGLYFFTPYGVILWPDGDLSRLADNAGAGGRGFFYFFMGVITLGFLISALVQAFSYSRFHWSWRALGALIGVAGACVSVGIIINTATFTANESSTYTKTETYELYATQNGNIVESSIDGEFYGGFLSGTSGVIKGQTETIDVIEYQYGEGDGGVRIGTVPRGDEYTVIYYDATEGTAYLEVKATCQTVEFVNTDFYDDSKRTSCVTDPMKKKYEFHLPDGTQEITWKVFD